MSCQRVGNCGMCWQCAFCVNVICGALQVLPIVCIYFEVPIKLINCIISSVDCCPQSSKKTLVGRHQGLDGEATDGVYSYGQRQGSVENDGVSVHGPRPSELRRGLGKTRHNFTTPNSNAVIVRRQSAWHSSLIYMVHVPQCGYFAGHKRGNRGADEQLLSQLNYRENK